MAYSIQQQIKVSDEQHQLEHGSLTKTSLLLCGVLET